MNQTAHARVRAYLDALESLGSPPLETEAIDAAFDHNEGATASITMGDLRTLVVQAEALHHAAPHAAHAIEIGPTK